MKANQDKNQTESVNSHINTGFKLGILGGGQLGKMLCQAASPMDLSIWILDSSKDFPAGGNCDRFIEGSFKNYEDVLAFGRQVDVLTIEIEHVNTEALHQLEKEGKTIHPAPAKLDIIKDKGLQKCFYRDHDLPTSSFELYADSAAVKTAVKNGLLSIPFVQKSRLAGYDGKGVAIIRNEGDWHKLIEGPCVIEPLVDIDKEIAVQVARNEKGDVVAFPAVEMTFHPEANLVEFLLCPANISPAIEKQATQLAIQTIEAYDLCGLLSIEFFLTNSGELLINEVAPRPHNSGHHTIEACITSQFQQHLRSVLNWPLGSTQIISPAVMINLLGEEGHTGLAKYSGIEKSLEIEGAYLHLYGKEVTKPFRKMGHATLLAPDTKAATEKARIIQNTLKIIA